MKPVPADLVALIKQVVPPEAEILPLDWTYEHEDYNLAVIVPDTMTYEQARQLEGRCIDVVMDYDATHGTFTLCMAWRQSEMAHAGIVERTGSTRMGLRG